MPALDEASLVLPFALEAVAWLGGPAIVGAVRHRRPGWESGLLFALPLLGLPAWMSMLLRLYARE